MHDGIKQWTKEALEKKWISRYAGRIDMEGNWIADSGRFIKWEIRDGKPQENWKFSVTLALSLAAITKENPMDIASELATYLSIEAPSGWFFKPMNGYINACFEPNSLRDYLKKGAKLNREILEATPAGQYALYRLDMIHKNLSARGVEPLSINAPLSEDCIKRFSELFELPQTAESWEVWAKWVSKMTQEGKLLALDRHMESALLTFLTEV